MNFETPAKINLGLEVGAELANGFHGLRTVFQSISLADRIEVARAEADDELIVEGSRAVPETEDNIVLQTLEFLRRQGLSVPPLRIKLIKNVPVGSGLGGGSSNAAGLIRFVLGLGFEYPRKELLEQEVAAELGADVAFLLRGGTASAAGIGEQLVELPDQGAVGLLAVPGPSVDTEQAYQQLGRREAGARFKNFPDAQKQEQLWKQLDLTNDFWPVAKRAHPELEEIKRKLEATGGRVGLTGSGSALYGLFSCRESLPNSRELEADLTGVEVHEVRFVRGWPLELDLT